MTRSTPRLLLIGLCALIFTMACASPRRRNAEAPSPNVILISIDTLAADHMSLYGYFRDTTPLLSKFAREGVTFENTFSQAAFTLPSHYSIFTGMYAHSHRIIYEGGKNAGSVLDNKYKTLTEHLKENGYATLWVGGTNDKQLNLSRGLGRGFDRRIDMDCCDGPENLRKLTNQLETLAGGKFFLFLHTYMVHDPYHPAPPYDRIFDPSFKRPIVTRYEALRAPKSSEDSEEEVARVRKRYFGQFDLDSPADHTHLVALYDGGIRTADAAMSEVFSQLKRLGLYDNSIIIVTSDHGETFGKRGYYLHVDPTHEEIHVPLVMKIPGVEPSRIHQPVLSIDILPTVLELIGAPVPPTVEGESLVALMQGKPAGGKDISFSHGGRSAAVWDRNWKLVRRAKGGQEFWLYNLDVDPYEQEDLATTRPDIVLRMKGLLDAKGLPRTARQQ